MQDSTRLVVSIYIYIYISISLSPPTYSLPPTLPPLRLPIEGRALNGGDEVKDLTVQVLLSGDFDRVYKEADNRPVIPTDTIKNTIYVLAQQDPLNSIEEFSYSLAAHFLRKYPWISSVSVAIQEFFWFRAHVEGKPSKFAFHSKSGAHRFARVQVPRSGTPHATSGIDRWELFKSTESGFENYNVCDLTTLAPTRDRIFSTVVMCCWEFANPSATGTDFNGTFDRMLEIITRRFSVGYSASVQATLYQIAEEGLQKMRDLSSVRLELPNRHYLPVDLSRFKITTNNTLFYPIDEPSGLITATISRKSSSSGGGLPRARL